MIIFFFRPSHFLFFENSESKLCDFSWLCFADILGGNIYSSDARIRHKNINFINVLLIIILQNSDEIYIRSRVKEVSKELLRIFLRYSIIFYF